jgi:hypothetical protein
MIAVSDPLRDVHTYKLFMHCNTVVYSLHKMTAFINSKKKALKDQNLKIIVCATVLPELSILINIEL